MSSKHTNYEVWAAKARAVRIENEVARRGINLRIQGAEHVGACPHCGGDDRFAINTNKQVFNCRGCGARGGVIALVEFLDGCDFKAACATLAGDPPPQVKSNGSDRDTSARKIVAEFSYYDDSGALAFAVERIEFQNPDGSYVTKLGKRKKSFSRKRPDPDRPGRWIYNVDDVATIPYRLPELLEALRKNQTILIVEGEADEELVARASKVRRGCRQRRPAGPSKNIWLCSITRPSARRPK
jgi:CHC2 zinc finger